MVNLNKWGISPNFKPKYVNVTFKKYSKTKAKLTIVPKNGSSIPLFKKATKVFESTKKKFKHTTLGKYNITKSGKRNHLLTQGFQIVIERV